MNKRTYIEMEYVRGENLGKAWTRVDGLSSAQKDIIFTDIKTHIQALRALQPPREDVVSSAFQNPAIDYRVGYTFFGPMDMAEFQSLTRGHLRAEDVQPFLGDEVHKMHTNRYCIRFAHADLAPRNILVKNRRVAAIIDWAFSGWYPEYWELTKSHFDSSMDEDWYERLEKLLPQYNPELEAERILWTRLPSPGAATTVYREGERHESDGSKPSLAWLKCRQESEQNDLWTLALSHH